ncbi:MAG: fibronectin type III domain-containing protein [Candidatus Micrarchaeota archaeon]
MRRAGLFAAILLFSTGFASGTTPEECTDLGFHVCSWSQRCPGGNWYGDSADRCCRESCLNPCEDDGGFCGQYCTLYYLNCSFLGTGHCGLSGAYCCTGECVDRRSIPLLITDISANVTSNSANITWITDSEGTSKVEYGPNDSYGDTGPYSMASVLFHSVFIDGLEANTAYHYRVATFNGFIENFSDDGSFTTLPIPLPPTPTPSPSPTRIPLPTPTPVPAPRLTPVPTPECMPEGKLAACFEGFCPGKYTCTMGRWTPCVKNNLCCGVDCDDGDDCTFDSCSGGECTHADSCSGQPPRHLPTATATPLANTSGIEAEAAYLESLISRLPPGEEAEELHKLSVEAWELYLAGKYGEAQEKWNTLSQRLKEALARTQNTSFMYNVALAGVAVAAMLGVLLYGMFANRSARKGKASDDRKNALARVNEIESERILLMKRFMTREVDYASYSQLTGALDKELLELRARLDERK